MDIEKPNIQGLSITRNKTWSVSITQAGKSFTPSTKNSWPRIPLGTYKTLDEALKVRLEAEVLWFGKITKQTTAVLSHPDFETYRGYVESIRERAGIDRTYIKTWVRNKYQDKLVQAEILLRFTYNSETGKLYYNYWNDISAPGLRRDAGDEAGSESLPYGNFKGHLSVMVMTYSFKLHNIAWLFWNGEWPKKELIHIDGDYKNNRIINLKEID
jgi:hypothetical protein